MPLRTTALPISLSLTSERQTAQSGLLLKGPLWIDGRLMESNGALTHAEAISHFLVPSHGFLNGTSFFPPPSQDSEFDCVHQEEITCQQWDLSETKQPFRY